MYTSYIVFVSLAIMARASAHSWVHCTAHNNTGILQDMKDAAAEIPTRTIDPLMPWFADLCHGWPRAKQNPGDWVDETKHYIWDLSLQGGRGDTHACHPSQRTPLYYTNAEDANLPYHMAPAPMATSLPGGSIKLMFGGNGHSRGFNVGGHGDPGRVAVYWKGQAEQEIVDVKELRPEYKLQENGFSEESFAWPLDMSVTKPPILQDKGNWMTLKLPRNMDRGRHMMVWVWSYGGRPRWTTCFDVMIE